MNILTQHLYTLMMQEEAQALVVLADEAHPVFKAHFEGNPLLPAFLQVDMIAEIFGLQVTGISRSKFMEPLRPSDEVLIRLEKRAQGVKVRLMKQERMCSEMSLDVR
jgi:3-hydroxyacyl-[acyl-carrier-protein] dehydratase